MLRWVGLFIRKPALGTGWRMNSGAGRRDYSAPSPPALLVAQLPAGPARNAVVPGLLPVVINTITRHRSILGVQLDRALCCQVLHLAGLSLFSHLARAVFGIFLFRASAISPVASPLGGCGTFCTSVVKERYCGPASSAVGPVVPANNPADLALSLIHI